MENTKKRNLDEISNENNEKRSKQEKKTEETKLEKTELKDDSIVYWCKNFLSSDEATKLYEHLLKEMNWIQGELSMFGKKVLTPRMQSWMADEGIDANLYQKQKQHPWTEPVLEIKKKLEEMLHCKFDYLLLNYYRNGNDYIGWHADREAIPESKSVIASMTLGETRKFVLKHNETEEKLEYQLTHGSLIVMAGKTQKYWKHTIPKQLKVTKPRLNLTFRIN